MEEPAAPAPGPGCWESRANCFCCCWSCCSVLTEHPGISSGLPTEKCCREDSALGLAWVFWLHVIGVTARRRVWKRPAAAGAGGMLWCADPALTARLRWCPAALCSHRSAARPHTRFLFPTPSPAAPLTEGLLHPSGCSCRSGHSSKANLHFAVIEHFPGTELGFGMQLSAQRAEEGCLSEGT